MSDVCSVNILTLTVTDHTLFTCRFWTEIRKRGRYALLPVLCALATTYFGYHMVHGEFGLLAYWRLTQEIATLQKDHDQVVATRERRSNIATVFYGPAASIPTWWMSGRAKRLVLSIRMI